VLPQGGTISVPGVYIGFLDKIPFGAAMGKGLTIKTGQTHVPRYHQLLLGKIEAGEIDPSFVVTHRLAPRRRSRGVPDVSGQEGRWHQSRAEALGQDDRRDSKAIQSDTTVRIYPVTSSRTRAQPAGLPMKAGGITVAPVSFERACRTQIGIRWSTRSGTWRRRKDRCLIPVPEAPAHQLRGRRPRGPLEDEVLPIEEVGRVAGIFGIHAANPGNPVKGVSVHSHPLPTSSWTPQALTPSG